MREPSNTAATKYHNNLSIPCLVDSHVTHTHTGIIPVWAHTSIQYTAASSGSDTGYACIHITYIAPRIGIVVLYDIGNHMSLLVEVAAPLRLIVVVVARRLHFGAWFWNMKISTTSHNCCSATIKRMLNHGCRGQGSAHNLATSAGFLCS